MRLFRIPYHYLTVNCLVVMRQKAIGILEKIYNIHHDVPEPEWHRPEVKLYMYYPVFLKWVVAKASTEIARRSKKHRLQRLYHLETLKSRKLESFLPPTERDIADDVVYLITRLWSTRFYGSADKTCKPLPSSYIEIASKYYAIKIREGDCQRIDDVSGIVYHGESEWYKFSRQERAQVFGTPLAKGIRICGNARKK